MYYKYYTKQTYKTYLAVLIPWPRFFIYQCVYMCCGNVSLMLAITKKKND